MVRPPRKRRKRALDCFLCGTRCPGQAAFAQHLTTHNLSDAYAATIAAQQAAGVESEARLHTAILHAPAPKPKTGTKMEPPLGLAFNRCRMFIRFGEGGGAYAF